MDILFRIFSRAFHALTARNTLGHGVHSPYLYNMVRFVIYDDNRYYCWDAVEKERRRLLRATKTLSVTDYGTGSSFGSAGSAALRRVCDIARTSLMPPRDAHLLFRLVNMLRPPLVLELGTSLGITTALLAAAAAKGRVVSFEGSTALADEARQVWKHLGIANAEVITGNIDSTLEQFLQPSPQSPNSPVQQFNNSTIQQSPNLIDFALLDANHTEEATLRYFGLLAAHAGPKSIFVLDDIRYSRSMYRAWKQIRRHPRVTSTIDLGDMGIALFDPDYLPRHYKMRI